MIPFVQKKIPFLVNVKGIDNAALLVVSERGEESMGSKKSPRNSSNMKGKMQKRGFVIN